jgi:hypothetical protein
MHLSVPVGTRKNDLCGGTRLVSCMPERSMCAALKSHRAHCGLCWNNDASGASGLVVECNESDENLGQQACRSKSGGEKVQRLSQLSVLSVHGARFDRPSDRDAIV